MTITEGWYIERDGVARPLNGCTCSLSYDGAFVAWLTDEQADAFPDPELIHDAWTIIANAGGWEGCSASPGWQEAAEKWRARYHALWVNGKEVAWLTDEQTVADELQPEPEQLPDGIRVGYLLDSDAEVPEGWERRYNNGWCAAPNRYEFPVEARRISAPPTPTTERVPWYEAVGRTLLNGEVIDAAMTTGPSKVRVCGFWQKVNPDGTVEVLVEDS
jgi:hypothetical protein